MSAPRVAAQRERTAGDLIKAVAAGRASSEGIATTALADAHDLEDLRAFITLDDRAPDRARFAPAGPLHGLVFSVKDTIEVAGLPATAGSAVLREHRPRRTASAVAALTAAGAVVLGKSNCAEFGMGRLEAWSPLGGQVRNPWSPSATPGGSSGGDAAAVAAGIAAFALATDFGGSVRFPAHCTGIAALRPTPGRLPLDGQLPQLAADPPPVPASTVQRRLQTPGFLARSVRDLRLLLRVVSPHDAAPTVRRAIWFRGDAGGEVTGSLRRAADVLRSAGVTVEEVGDPGVEQAADALAELRATESAEEIAWWARGREDELGPVVRDELDRPPRTVDRDLPWRLDRVRRDAETWIGSADVALAPVAIGPAFAIVAGEQPDRSGFDRACRWVTVLGWPSVVVPVAESDGGLPLGVQVVARPGADETALAAALLIERAVGRWSPGSMR